MVPAGIICRIFKIKYNNGTGTMFAINVNGKQYCVTARHVIENAKTNFKVDILFKNEWNDLNVKLIGHSTQGDVSVFCANERLFFMSNEDDVFDRSYFLSQDVFFLGFPYDFYGDIPSANNGFPLPFIKRALISMIVGDNNNVLYLDGINNPGFSGGPVVYQPYGTNICRIAGVISGFFGRDEHVSDGTRPTPMTYSVNTGLIAAVPIQFVLNIIEKNPTGLDLSLAGT